MIVVASVVGLVEVVVVKCKMKIEECVVVKQKSMRKVSIKELVIEVTKVTNIECDVSCIKVVVM